MDVRGRGRRRPGSPKQDVEGWKANPPCSVAQNPQDFELVSLFYFGEMTERPKVYDWKSYVPGRVPRVQIPLSP